MRLKLVLGLHVCFFFGGGLLQTNLRDHGFYFLFRIFLDKLLKTKLFERVPTTKKWLNMVHEMLDLCLFRFAADIFLLGLIV